MGSLHRRARHGPPSRRHTTPMCASCIFASATSPRKTAKSGRSRNPNRSAWVSARSRMARGALLPRTDSRAKASPPAPRRPSPSPKPPPWRSAATWKWFEEASYVDSWQSPFRKDPFEIPLENQLALLLAADAEMRRVKGVTLTETGMQFRKIDSWFASSIGSRIHQRKMITGCGIAATSFQGDEIQKRSYPNSFGGQHSLEGYELVESLELAEACDTRRRGSRRTPFRRAMP